MPTDPDVTTPTERQPRRRSPRGSGELLRDDLLAAAGRLLEGLGAEEALSLRGVAREAGVSAPSIYLHFPDKDALVLEVLRRRFDELGAALDAAAAGHEADPAAELLARALAYCAYAEEHPGAYRVMFDLVPPDRDVDPASLVGPEMMQVNARLLGRCGVRDPHAAAVVLWCGLHGIVGLRRARPLFPWPERDALVRRLVADLLPQ